MIKLLNSKDSNVLKNPNTIKSVEFYKDLLAFYDAYQNLLERDLETLPNYCYWNGSLCLEGICLFMKDYSSELGFSSLNLNLNYLKFLYYTIAKYSVNGFLPSRTVFEDEYNAYKSLINENISSKQNSRNQLEKEFNQVSTLYNEKFHKNLKNKTLQHTFNVLAIFFLIAGIFCVIAPFTFYFLNTLELVFAIIISLGCVAVGVALFLIFKKLSQIYNATENGLEYEAKSSKNIKEEKYNSLKNAFGEINKLICEKYDAEHDIFDIVFNGKRLEFDEILKIASEYSILSYNIKSDCLNLFKTQDEDIKQIISLINKPVKTEEAKKHMSDIYKLIEKNDWLFYNGEIRLSFISKFIEYAEKIYDWQLDGSQENTPYSLNLKTIAKEKIAFLNNPDALFISSSIDKFSIGLYLKKQNIFKLKRDISKEEFYNIKLAYITKFYDYEKLKDFNNLFYDKKIGSGAKVSEQIINNYKKVPTLILLRLKLLETNLGLSNSDNTELQKLCQNLFGAEDMVFESKLQIKEKQPEPKIEINTSVVPKTIFECDEIEEDNTFVTKYKIDGETINGYKIS